MICAIVKNMGSDGTVFDSQYNSLFKCGSAKEGVALLIQSGNYSINGIAIPESAEAFEKSGYKVNENEWMTKNADGSYTVDRKKYDSYSEAALALISRLPAGLETRLYDTDGDGFADRADADYFDAIIVRSFSKNKDGSVTIRRASLENGLSYPQNAGRVYDGNFDAIDVVSFDESIQAGDVGLLQKKSDGFRILRAVHVQGVFTGGGDHEFYEIDGTRYQDAMRFSRDNIIISNRPGEYANVRSYFGFTKNAEKINLWLSPVTQAEKRGAPVSLTSGENARLYLSKAIEIAKTALEKSAANEGAKAEVAAVIQLSESALEKDLAPELLDYQTYLLFLALHGSKDDIGAEYAGFNFAGLVN